MEEFVKGDIVVIPFPFSNLSSLKRRPALVLVNLPGPDVILCQITSKLRKDEYSISLNRSDFKIGELLVESCIRVDRIFTVEKSLVLYKVGSLQQAKMNIVLKYINIMFNS
ncbi:MAG: type II toxin-antitoxin system PemK/MazF family toxin [Cyclobacteriaceae bacterium]|nr:type II toxin-antitoxin system PemK/MazF family toxin [Bacteroidetes bacterium CHB5]QLH32470.1 MAG: type II toxin-antitoxin system PemK/MazF family toxin [Cyclobacteriaceae bacterium]